MDPDLKQPLRSISDASHACLDLFESCFLRNADVFAELEAAERQFRAWTNNLRVFGKNASLDTQLRADKYDEYRQMITLLLQILNENLSLALKMISPSESEPSTKPFLEIPLFGINGSLKRLENIAAVILQATQGSLIKRTIIFAEKHEDFERLVRTFSMIILSRYRELAPKNKLENVPLQMSEDLIPTKEKVLAQHPEGLFLTLVKTSVVRHFKILYERSRRDKERKSTEAPAKRSSLPQDPDPVEDHTIQRQTQSNASEIHETNQTAPRSDEEQSEKPTELSIDENGLKAGIAGMGAGMGSENTSGREKVAPPISESGVALYPRAPKILDGQEEGTCPICKRVLPAEELKGVKWILHATKDIKPYVCIFADCMSNIQFFERRRHWIDHMHKVHTPLWIRYLHNSLVWDCSQCHSISPEEFISREEMKSSYEKHLQQYHSDIEKREWQHLVSSSVVPQPRPSENCPICGTLHLPRVIPQLKTQSEAMKETIRAGTQVSKHRSTTDSSKRRVMFAAPEASDDEDRKHSTEISSPKSSAWRSTRATDDHGVENCIAEHIRALALNFSTRLIDDDQRASDVPSSRSSDSDQLELEDLPEIGSEDDPPRIPSGKCDEIDHFSIPNEEKIEMKNCIARNIQALCAKSDEQINWNFNWVDGFRDIEPNLSNEELKRLFPDSQSLGTDGIWSGMNSKYVPAYVACLFMIVEFYKKVLVGSEMGGNNKSNAQECLDNAEAFSKVRQVVFGKLYTKGTAPKSSFVLAVEQSAKSVEDIRAQLSSTSKTSMIPDTSRAPMIEKLLETEKRLYFHLGKAALDGGCIKGILKIDMTAEFNPYLNERQRQAIGDVLSAIRSENFDLQQIVAGRINTLASGSSMPPEEPSKPLKSLLRASLVISPYTRDRDQSFIPRRQLQIKRNVKTIAKELKQLFPRRNFNSCENLASLICHGSTRNSSIISKPCFKIFAILVLMDKAKLIDYFQRNSLCDDDLPFHYDSNFNKMWPKNKEEKDHIQFPEGVDDDFVEDFVRVQWQLLAPSFKSPESSSLRCNFYEFDDKTILPITKVSKNKHTGGIGVVERIQLHEEHHEFKPSHFALKTIHSMIPFDLRSTLFEQELKAFQQAKPGSHLIDVCAAFKKGENYHFLFPWADGGTLNHLWTKDPQAIVANKQVQWSEFSRWVCRQCHGVIRDLRTNHEPHDTSQTKDKADGDDLYGIHGDIKPDNILHFTDDGTPLGILKVSDLGLIKFHRLISQTVQSKSMGAAYQTYRAPEHDMGMMRTRKIDIWASGCLFSEFLTWAVAGQGGIDHFKNMRMDEDRLFPDPKKGEWSEDHFFTMRTGQPKQKDSVAEWFAHMSEGLGEDTFFPQFLSFIQNVMLHPDRKKRVDWKDVELFLERCLGNDVESSYWLFDGKLTEKYSLNRSSTNSSSWSSD